MTMRGWRIEYLDAAPSTQDLAIAAAHANAPDRAVFIAARQTAGRGRDGRVWRAPEGNLNFSALLRPGPIRPVPAQWSLMAGVAIYDAVAAFLPNEAPKKKRAETCLAESAHAPALPAQAPQAPPRHPLEQDPPIDGGSGGGGTPHPVLLLKWPNDLLLAGAKLAGILIDSALAPGGLLDWVVIGIGANLAEAPVLPDRPTTCLAGHGVHVTAADLATRLMQALDEWSPQDLPAIRAAWLARAHPPGTPLRVHQGSRVIEGVFETLAPDGSLVLRGHAPMAFGETSLAPPKPAEGAHASGG